MSEELRKFRAEVAQQDQSLKEKESTWRRFLKNLIGEWEAHREMHQKMHKVADKFEKAGRPMGGAKDD